MSDARPLATAAAMVSTGRQRRSRDYRLGRAAEAADEYERAATLAGNTAEPTSLRAGAADLR